MNKPEPPPMPNKRTPIWHLVIDDMHERDATGRAKYGTPLQPHNGRNPLVDAYQESLDQTVYLRQAIEEQRYQPVAMILLRTILAEAERTGAWEVSVDLQERIRFVVGRWE